MSTTGEATPKPAVVSTEHIFFDETLRTFRLYAGNSLYAMSISPELTLEHLYWGKTLHPGYDLRYLNRSSRVTHFSTLEAAPDNLEAALVHCDSMKDIQETWREAKTWKTTADSMEAFHKRRLENYSWRAMLNAAKCCRGAKKHNGHPPAPLKLKTFSSAELAELLPSEEISPPFTPPPASRSRAQSVPPARHFGTANSVTPFQNPKAHESDRRNYDTFDTTVRALRLAPKTPIRSPIKRKPSFQYGIAHAFERGEGEIGKGSVCIEYGDQGTGDFRSPSFVVMDCFDGSSISPLKYRKHRIYAGKLPMPDGQPAIRCSDDSEASTLVVTMGDIGSGLEVDLIYVAMHNFDVVTRRVEFRNMDYRVRSDAPLERPSSAHAVDSESKQKVIQKACSLTMDFEAAALPFRMLQLSGSWGRERYVVETRLHHGMHSFGSTRGVSGHQHNPFAVLTLGSPSETQGEVRAFSLVYSGNFLVEAETNETGRLRINLGMGAGLQWHLKQGKSFCTPEAIVVRSDQGVGGMSRTLHRLFLDNLIPRSWADTEMPVILNTWEAKYFQVSHANVVDMARQAVKLGVNLVVVDDGWFGRRDDDMTSLGDWVPNPTKFPLGMRGLAAEVNALGCKFGLWFEPEMISEDSNLFNAHPDWYLHVPGRPRQMGRNQMVLDLSRQEVCDYLYQEIAAILTTANVEYIKWDMNRPLTEVFTTAKQTADGDTVWQAEVSHRYVLGLYWLQGKLTANFPNLLLENCASGGGRFDPGMLFFSPQIWCSDNTDAVARMKIQHGTSLAYPTRTVGAHVSTVPNHTTGNTTRLRTRGFVATCGTFGYELDVNLVSASERVVFHRQVTLFRMLAPTIWWGDMYRLWNPFKSNLASWMYVSRDKSHAVVFAFSVNSDHWSNLVPHLQLQGLLPDAEYEVDEHVPNNVSQRNLAVVETEAPVYQLGVSTAVTFTGEILMSAGLPVKFFTLDDSALFTVTQVDTKSGKQRSTIHNSHRLGI